jgi:outer membrane biosynthesis protein TonB
MDRIEKTGLGVAIVGHLILFGLLSVGFLSTPNPEQLKPKPIDVSLVDDVGMQAQAPQSTVPPSQSRAPDLGKPEDAAPPAQQEAQPDPVPPAPQPEAAPPPKPAPQAPPQPKKPVAPAPDKAKTPPKHDAAPPSKTKAANAKAIGTDMASTKQRPRGSRLGDDFLKGLSDQPSKTQSVTPMAAKIDAQSLASIQQAIARQIQPCADRQVNPGPGANQIMTVLNLRLNKDGTLAALPTMVRQNGLTDENSRYARRVTDLGIAAFKGCSPLKLPPEYYATPNGGWNNINYNWQLR